jgi:hypothetical protein
MKDLKTLISTVVFVLLLSPIFALLSPIYAQNVGINQDGSSPNANAILDLKSSTKGLLIPRMGSADRMAIPNTKGLLVYDTITSSFWYNTGISWQNLVGGTVDSSGSSIVFQYGDIAAGDNAWATRIGGWNTVIGDAALSHTIIQGDSNTAIGSHALYFDANGYENVAVGATTLYFNTSGKWNTGVGSGAMEYNTTGSSNTGIGAFADVSTGGLSNATAVGFGATVNASNKVRIGNGAVTVIEGQVPFTTPSDGRYKFHVQEDVKGLDFILKLRPVTYQFDVQRFDESTMVRQPDRSRQPAPSRQSMAILTAYREATAIRRSGFIAQEVEKAALSSGYSFSGIIRPNTPNDHYSLSYESFVVPLVKAVQEQQAQIESLQKQIDELKKKTL